MIAKNINKVEYINGDNAAIQFVVEKNLFDARNEVKDFAKQFARPTITQTANAVWNYLKKNVRYKADPDGEQNIKLPARLLSDGYGDCKSFALFAAAIMSWYCPVVGFRYTSYNTRDKQPTHVYAICFDKNREIIIDGVWNRFNHQKPFYFHKDKTFPMPKISTLSGVDTVNNQSVDPYTFRLLANYSAALKANKPGTPIYNHIKKQLNYYKQSAGIDRNDANGEINGLKLKSLVKQVKAVVAKPKIVAHAAAQAIKSGAKPKAVLQAAGAAAKDGSGKALIKTVALAPGRVDFLILVQANFRDIAARLDKMNPMEVKDFWVTKLGGDYTALKSAINAGKNRKPLFGKPKGISEPVTVAAVLSNPATLAALATSAAAVIAAVVKFFKDKNQDLPDGNTPDKDLTQLDPKHVPDVSDGGDTTPSDLGEGADHNLGKKQGSNLLVPLAAGGLLLAKFM